MRHPSLQLKPLLALAFVARLMTFGCSSGDDSSGGSSGASGHAQAGEAGAGAKSEGGEAGAPASGAEAGAPSGEAGAPSGEAGAPSAYEACGGREALFEYHPGVNGVIGPIVDSKPAANDTQLARAVMALGGKSGEAYIHYVVRPDCSSNVFPQDKVFVASY